MRNISWLAIAMTLILWGQGCTPEPRLPASLSDPKAVEISHSRVLDVPVPQMRENLKESYQLKADRRFTLAFGELRHFLSGKPAEPNDADIAESIGRLPKFPKFDEVLEALTKKSILPWKLHSESEKSDLEAIFVQKEFFFAPYLFTGLRLTDKLWAKKLGNREALKSSLELLTRLYFQTPDLLESSDIIAAKALALVAILKSANESVWVEEALLAKKMGYDRHARQVARELRNDDAVRLYILESDQALEDAAKLEGAKNLTKYLWLSRLAEKGEAGKWELFRKTHFNFNTSIVSAHGTAYENLAYNPMLVQSSLVSLMDTVDVEGMQQRSTATALEIAEELKNKKWDEAKFKSLVEGMNKYSKGPFLDQRSFSAYMQSAYQSNLFHQAKQEIQKLQSTGSGNFRLPLVDSSSGEFSRSLSNWYSELYRQVAVREKSYKNILLHGPILVSGYRPSFLVFRLSQIQGYQLPLAAYRYLTSQLDTRPSHLYLMSEIALNGLNDVELSRQMGQQIAAFEETSPVRQLLTLREQGKIEELFVAAQSDNRSWEEKLAAANLLFGMPKVDDERLRETYRSLIKSHGDRWEVREAYLNFLAKHSNFKAAEIVIRDYLATRGVETGFGFVRAKVAMARFYELQERFSEASKELHNIFTARVRDYLKTELQGLIKEKVSELDLRPIHSMEKLYRDQLSRDRRNAVLEVLVRPVSALLRDSKFDEAEKLTAEFANQFEDFFEIRALKSQIFWAKKEWQKAARNLNLNAGDISESEWLHWVDAPFKKQTKSLDEGERQKALAAMEREGFSKLRLEALKTLEANAPAITMADSELPREKRNALSVKIYGENQDDLLWTYIENPDDGGQSEYVWLLRAAAYLRAENKDQTKLKALKFYFSHEGSSHYFTIGRHLMGLIDESQAFAAATNENEKCELAYYLGVKADGEGRWADASEWYRVVAETELNLNSEYQWAIDRLKSKTTEFKHFY